MGEAKPFEISKHVVWEAYKRVKANKGAAGIDDESISAFEERLKDNLYKIWNRMSSGSYFPPPVKVVEIPKKSGGTRILGVPTVADRIAQMVAKQNFPYNTSHRSYIDNRWRCRHPNQKNSWVELEE
jgi:RNA-directed DNA polymerase